MRRQYKAFCSQTGFFGICPDMIKQKIRTVFCFRLNINRSSILVLGLLLFFSGFISSPAFASEVVYAREGRKCSRIKDRVQRLLCFDDLFKSTLEQAKIESVPEIPAKQAGPIRLMATLLEEQRVSGETNWIMRMRPWHQAMLLTSADYEHGFSGKTGQYLSDEQFSPRLREGEAVDIFMTMREAGIPKNQLFANKAILMLSCENDITTLGVLLPKPITTLQANLSLSSGSGSLFRLNWRDVENGDVVIAGRGLESIDTIKTIANYERVQLQVTYPEGARSFFFDMHDLKDRLKPLRTACHW